MSATGNFCSGFDVELSEADFVPVEIGETEQYGLGVNRVCYGRLRKSDGKRGPWVSNAMLGVDNRLNRFHIETSGRLSSISSGGYSDGCAYIMSSLSLQEVLT